MILPALSRGTSALRRGSGHRRHPASGAMAVEFAAVLLLFLTMVFGIIDAGRFMMARWLVSYAIERGGRVATMRSTTSVSQVQTAVSQTATMIGLVSTNVNVEVNGVATSAAFTARGTGDTIRVYTTYGFKRAVSFLWPSATININGATITTME